MESLKRVHGEGAARGTNGTSAAGGAVAGRPPGELLARHPLVSSLSDRERRVLLGSTTVRQVDAGTVLIAVGDPPGPLLLVLAGTARVVRDGRDVARVGPGSWVGELSLLEGRPDHADVVALDAMVVGIIAPDDARRVLEVDAVALQLDSVARRRWASNRAAEVEPVEAGLRDGGRALLRPVVASDWEALATGDGRVSDRSLRMRFFSEPPRSERRFRELTDPDFRHEFAWAALVDGLLVGIGRYALQVEDRSRAELAVLVADADQGRGIGRLLLAALVVAAEVHGVDELVAITRAENAPIRRMLGRLGADFEPTGDDGVVAARWPLATALAALPEGVPRDELHRVATVVLDPVREG